MIRDFSNAKKEELYRNLEVIDNKEWRPFMIWCGGRAGEFGVWADKLGISSYTRQIDNYQNRVLNTNDSTRNQIDVIFENVGETDRRYAEIFCGYAETVKEQMARVQVMIQVMNTVNGDNTSKSKDDIHSDGDISLEYAVVKWIRNSDDILTKFSQCDKETQVAIKLLDVQICNKLGITDINERTEIIQTILHENPSIFKNLYILNVYSGADYQRLLYITLFDIEEKYRFLTEEGLMFLFEFELGDREGWEQNEILKLDEEGNIIEIKVHDAKDGGYTIGPGIFISEDYQDRIELAESLGIDWNNFEEWVPIEKVNIMYSHIAKYYHDTVKNAEKSADKLLTSEQYDAVYSLLYWKPFLNDTIVKLIRTNASEEDWNVEIKNALCEEYGNNIFDKYPGWIIRIERSVKLYFDGEY